VITDDENTALMVADLAAPVNGQASYKPCDGGQTSVDALG